MVIHILKAKLHNLKVTDSNLNYQGSIGLDGRWIKEVGIFPYEKVQVYNISNGERFETYMIEEEAGSKRVVMNGAAARKAQIGDKIIVACYAILDELEVAKFKPRILIFDSENEIKERK